MKKVKSSISMVFDLVSCKSQLLVSLNCMRMLGIIYACAKMAINSHHVLAPSTFELANLFA